MNILLQARTENTVETYFYKTRDAEIQRFLPQKAQTLAEAVQDYKETLDRNAKSYGRTIYADGKYVGDIWCYGIHEGAVPDAMVSYCIFEKQYWRRGIATEALKLFLDDVMDRFHLGTVGAFTYAANIGSVRVLENNHFQLVETFVENGIASKYFQLSRSGKGDFV